MTPALTAEARQLFEAGTRDRLACTLLVESRRAPFETVGFLAQQACEKYIKSRIVLAGGVVSRTHDLDYLVDLAEHLNGSVPVRRADLRQLNPFAVTFRYEGHFQGGLDEAQVLSMVEALHRWCEAALADGGAFQS